MIWTVLIGTITSMGKHEHLQFIYEVERFCEAKGITPQSLCRKATGNPRKWHRLIGKLNAIEADMARIREAMSDKPGSST